MRRIKVAAAELNQTPLDWEGNQRRIRLALEEARTAGASVVCLPELALTGYGCEDMFLSPGLVDGCWSRLESLLPATRGLVTAIGMPVRVRRAVLDAVAVCVDGRLCGVVPKQHLAGDGLHYEPRWFSAWPAGGRESLETPLGTVPVGDLLFDVAGVRVGFEICQDAWVAARPAASLATRGADLLLNPSASHFSFGKAEVRRRFVLEASRSCSVTYLYANLVGNEAGRAVYDGGALIAHDGRLVASGRRFSFADRRLITAVVDVDETRLARSRQRPTLVAEGMEAAARGDVRVPFFWPHVEPEKPAADSTARDSAPNAPAAGLPSWEQGPHVKEEEFARAVALGLFDYARKSRATGFVLSLSGGADSGALACLVRLALELAQQELGMVGLRQRWPTLPPSAADAGLDGLMPEVLLTAYQSTAHSGPVTREAARAVAADAGARHVELDVSALVDSYVKLSAEALGRPLAWETDDLAMQNVQARVRAPSVWLLANVRGALLLSTSNRSEASVGYATMDGDTAGGLAPLAGIDKPFLRHWLRWLERHAPQGLAPMPSLRHINSQAPTAELRPPERHQTDEADLMPYEVLDRIERLAMRDHHAPAEVLQRLQAERGESTAQLAAWVERYFRLFCRNQWKRERYAPSFHLDDIGLDPRGWLRFPILSGGFDQELSALPRSRE